jgi:Tol biopolymer transport system component
MTRIRWCAPLVTLSLVVACGGGSRTSAGDVPTVTTLSPEGARSSGQSYSPDGTRVAYWQPGTDSLGMLQLWVANADLSNAKALPVRGFQSSRPAWSPDGARVAASSSEYGSMHVVAVTIATGAVQRVTSGTGVEYPLVFSRDGGALAVFGTSKSGTLSSQVADLRTGAIRPLTPGESRAAFGTISPDGSHVAYFVLDGDKTTVWVADSLGHNPHQLTTEGFETLVQYHEWSPDGTQLLYESRRTGTSDLWIVPIDGGAPRQLTHNVRNDYGGLWSPDGKWIAFFSDRGRQTDLWVVPSAGGEERRVTNSPTDKQPPVAWRGGSNELRFSVKNERRTLWALDLASGKERQLTPDSLRISDFWAPPAGDLISLVVERGGGARDLAVVPVGGGAVRTLVSGDATISTPHISPDGTQIVYSSDRAGTEDIWVVSTAGGAPRQLVNWPGYEQSPVWSADGSTIYFVSSKDARLGDVWKVPAAGGEPVRVTRNGTLQNLNNNAASPAMLAGTISPRGGQLGIARLYEDGRLVTIWERSNIVSNFSRVVGDSVAAHVEQPDGTRRAMLLAPTGSGGRVILGPTDRPGNASSDGKSLFFYAATRGSTDLGIFTLADGGRRMLTNTPEDETGAEFFRDGKSVIFLRVRSVERIQSVDVSKLLEPKGK